VRVYPELLKWMNNEMQRREWNKAEVARQSGISETTIGRLLAGRRKALSDDVAERLAKAFDLDLAALDLVSWGMTETRQGWTRFPSKYEILLKFIVQPKNIEAEKNVFRVAKKHGMKVDPAWL